MLTCASPQFHIPGRILLLKRRKWGLISTLEILCDSTNITIAHIVSHCRLIGLGTNRLSSQYMASLGRTPGTVHDGSHLSPTQRRLIHTDCEQSAKFPKEYSMTLDRNKLGYSEDFGCRTELQSQESSRPFLGDYE